MFQRLDLLVCYLWCIGIQFRFYFKIVKTGSVCILLRFFVLRFLTCYCITYHRDRTGSLVICITGIRLTFAAVKTNCRTRMRSCGSLSRFGWCCTFQKCYLHVCFLKRLAALRYLVLLFGRTVVLHCCLLQRGRYSRWTLRMRERLRRVARNVSSFVTASWFVGVGACVVRFLVTVVRQLKSSFYTVVFFWILIWQLTLLGNFNFSFFFFLSFFMCIFNLLGGVGGGRGCKRWEGLYVCLQGLGFFGLLEFALWLFRLLHF